MFPPSRRSTARPARISPLLVLATAACGVVGGATESTDPAGLREQFPVHEMPDWRVVAVSFQPERTEPGTPVTITAQVVNDGEGSAHPADVDVSIQGRVVGTARIGALAPGEVTQVRIRFDSGEPGVRPVEVRVRPAGDQLERDGLDNAGFAKLRVVGDARARPELELQWEREPSEMQLRAGEPFSNRLVVRNVGLPPTPAVIVHLRLGGELVASSEVPGLEPGARHPLPVDGLRLQAGDNLITARIDWPRTSEIEAESVAWFVPVSTKTVLLSGNVAHEWTSIGPSIIGNYGWVGRMTAFAFDPSDGQTLYAGGSGIGQNGTGVWKSTNGGRSWQPVTDRLDSLCVGALAVDPGDPSIVYCGTGSYRPRGVFKSIDGGTTWSAFAPAAVFGANPSVTRIEVARSSAGVSVYVATNRGLYRWRGSDPRAQYGTPSDWQLIRTGDIVHIELRPRSDVVYASVRAAGLFRCDDGPNAGGDTDWLALTAGLPAANADQFMRFDVHATMPDTLWVAVYTPVPGQLLGIYRSDDGGDHWRQLALFQNGSQLPSGKNGNHPYLPFLRVSATNPPRLYFGGTALFRATELPAGGLDVLTLDAAAYDLKAFEIDPSDSGRYFSLGDQGVFEGRVGAATDTIVGRNHELRVAQFYDIDVSPTRPEVVIGGTQDTGTLLRTAAADPWKMIRYGDGYHSLILPPNANGQEIMFSQHQFFGSTWWTDKGLLADAKASGVWNGLSGGPADTHPDGSVWHYAGNAWITKHPDAPLRVFSQGPVAHVVKGPAFASWQPLGPQGSAVAGSVQRIFVQPGSGTLVAGMTSGQIWYATGAGTPGTWKKAFDRDFDPAAVTSLAFSPADPAQLYILYQGGTRHDMRIVRLEHAQQGGFLVTGYLGSDLPQGVALNVISGDGFDPNVAYVGTSVGVFRCEYGRPVGQSCKPYNTGLPLTSVSDLVVAPDRRLLAGMRCRGAWRIDTRPTNAADLHPVQAHPELDGPIGFCSYDAGGRLRVRVRNSGTAPGVAQVVVVFDHGGERSLDLGVLAPGQDAVGAVEVPAPIPAGDISFTIRVLVRQAETDLDNNVVRGKCIG